MSKLYISILCIIYLALTSCEKDIEFMIPTSQQKLVIDGWIESNKPPMVLLSWNTEYFGDIDSLDLRNLIEAKAKITVSTDSSQEILTLKRNDGFFPPFIYQGTDMIGKEGKTYHLKVELSGEIYTATTSIPYAKEIDSTWLERVPLSNDLCYLYIRFQDNPLETNFYRILTKRIGIDKRYVPVYFGTLSDRFFNGQDRVLQLLRGPKSSGDSDDVHFTNTDTILVQFATITEEYYNFWKQAENNMYIAGNPFAESTTKLMSNIKGNNVLGVWGGYAAKYYKIRK